MARKRNPARLVIALSVAAVLAVFLLYTSIAGGGTPSVAPSELAGKTVTVVYTGSVSDQFRAGREVSVKGELRNGTFVAVKDSLVTKCPSKYTAKKSS